MEDINDMNPHIPLKPDSDEKAQQTFCRLSSFTSVNKKGEFVYGGQIMSHRKNTAQSTAEAGGNIALKFWNDDCSISKFKT